jgi:hypothetical protein
MVPQPRIQQCEEAEVSAAVSLLLLPEILFMNVKLPLKMLSRTS